MAQQIPTKGRHVFGDLSSGGHARSGSSHGGPGAGHEHLLSFADLWPQYGLPVVFYDQIGCGGSTHLPQTAGDKTLWKEPLFVAELNNLLGHLNLVQEGLRGFHLLGQSWGGMLGAAFAASRPRGLRRLVLASALASKDLSIRSIQLRRKELPLETQSVLDEYEQKGDYEHPDYKEAMAVFAKRYLFRAEPSSPDLMPGFKNLSDDKTERPVCYMVHTNGSNMGWTSIPRLPQITAPTLVYNGEYDTSHDIGQVPFFELIPRVRWITFANGGHMCHLEGGGRRERVLKVVGEFLMQDMTQDKASIDKSATV